MIRHLRLAVGGDGFVNRLLLNDATEIRVQASVLLGTDVQITFSRLPRVLHPVMRLGSGS